MGRYNLFTSYYEDFHSYNYKCEVTNNEKITNLFLIQLPQIRHYELFSLWTGGSSHHKPPTYTKSAA
jgi:hypothetical protein